MKKYIWSSTLTVLIVPLLIVPLAALAHPEAATLHEFSHTAEHLLFGPNHHISSVVIAMISLYLVSALVALCVGIVMRKQSAKQTVKQITQQR